MTDTAFTGDRDGLIQAVELLLSSKCDTGPSALGNILPDTLPKSSVGEAIVLGRLAPLVLDGARQLDRGDAFAHMDPPTPWITWATMLWNAALNQNLLHPDTAPVARDIEARVIEWLAPHFGMDGGHMCPGSTLANLTAIWAAREVRGVRRVVSSDQAHLSIAKAAHILGLQHEAIATHADGTLNPNALPADLSDACLVLTAGGTSSGTIDPLALCAAPNATLDPAKAQDGRTEQSAVSRVAWVHVDAAWAGPLCLTNKYRDVLAGIDQADSIAVSAHKWLFQPKESALVLFRNTAIAHPAISFGGAYLAAPNIGILGSHGAMAVPLLATLMAWGKDGLADRIESCMSMAEDLYKRLDDHVEIETFNPPVTGVLLWRPKDQNCIERVAAKLPDGMTSQTRIGEERWFRQVAANPMAEIDLIWDAIVNALSNSQP